jgi:hypothetical protein
MPARRVGAPLLVVLGVLLGSFTLLAQARRPISSPRNRGTDVTTHKFHPVVSPDSIAFNASGMPMPVEQSNQGERPQWQSPELKIFGAAPERLCEFKSRRCVTGILESASCALSG